MFLEILGISYLADNVIWCIRCKILWGGIGLSRILPEHILLYDMCQHLYALNLLMSPDSLSLACVTAGVKADGTIFFVFPFLQMKIFDIS